MSDAPQIGPYTLQRLLGGGGMADVYLAWDNNNRWPVALKLMRAATGQDARMLKRFEREAATLMKLRHPHIIQVYDAGQTADGRPYIAMEYVTGGDLVELMHARRGKLTTTESLYLMRRVAGAMAYAHERGIVHRDLKPSNILLRADTGEPVIADLGIAALAGAKPLTGTMEALGTPQYMAPEQGSQHGAADGRADVYAIGVMLFELLIGRLPFEGDNGWALLLQKQQEDAPPVLSRRRDLDPRLAAVVDTCLRRDPAARYPTVGALATALDAFLPATDEALAAALLAPAATSTTAPTSAPPTDTPQPVPTTATNLPVAEIIAPIDGATLVAGGPVALVIAASDAVGLAGVTIEVNGRTLAAYTLDGEPLFTRTINWDAPPTAGDVVFTVWAVNIHDVPSQPVSVAVTLGVEETPTRTATPTRAATTETSGGRTATATRPAGTATQSATAPPAGPAGPTTLLGFEAFGGWVRGVPNGTLTQSSEQTHGGSFAAKLEYNFPGAGNDFVDFTQEHDIEGAPNALQLWVYGDESDHYLNVWIRDDEGERWSVDLGRVQHTGWQRMTGRIDAEAPWPGGHVDGPDNGQIDYPIRFSAIVLDDRPDDYVGQGVIYLDDLVATTLDE